MNGNLMYEIARQRMAEQQRAAQQRAAQQRAVRQQAGEARPRRAIARWRRAKATPAEEIAIPAIPDFAAEMFQTARDTVPAPRAEEAGGRPARFGWSSRSSRSSRSSLSGR